MSTPVFAQSSAATECADVGSVCTWLYELTGNGDLARLSGSVVGPVVRVAIVALVAAVVVRIGKRLIARTAQRSKTGQLPRHRSMDAWQPRPNPRKTQRIDAVAAIATSILAAVVWAMALLAILGNVGIDLAPLIAGAGIIGVALGFGAQDLVKDFLSGLFMLAEDQFGIGDVIDAGEAVGVVEGISLRTTRVRDVTGTLWHIPNGEITRVGNMSQEWARALLDVGVSYATDIDQASQVILDVATQMAGEDTYAPDFVGEPEIWGVENLGADSVDIRLVIKTTPGTQWTIARELRRRIKYALEGADIEIPFPQRTVWLRTDANGTDLPDNGVGDD